MLNKVTDDIKSKYILDVNSNKMTIEEYQKITGEVFPIIINENINDF